MAYATCAQLAQLGINTEALSEISTATQEAVLTACSARVDDALSSGGRYTPPLTTWPSSVTLNVCKLAQYELIGCEGYTPDHGAEPVILQRYQQAEKWLEALAKGAEIYGAVDSTPDVVGTTDSEPGMSADDARGW